MSVKDDVLYGTWCNMRNRCNNKGGVAYKDYGARGISVCSRWDDFYTFKRDMGTRPPGTELDRIDNDGNYEPENCRWATRLVNARNRRNNRFLTFEGERLTISEWSLRTGIRRQTIQSRLGYGWSEERTLSEPVQKHKPYKKRGSK